MYAQHMLQLLSCHILTLIHACLKVCLNNVQYILFVIALSLKNPTCKRLNNEDCLKSNYSNALESNSIYQKTLPIYLPVRKFKRQRQAF